MKGGEKRMQKQTVKQIGNESQFMALGVMGAIVGGAVGSVLAVALADKDTRKKVVDTITTFQGYMRKYPELKEKAKETLGHGEKLADKYLLQDQNTHTK